MYSNKNNFDFGPHILMITPNNRKPERLMFRAVMLVMHFLIHWIMASAWVLLQLHLIRES